MDSYFLEVPLYEEEISTFRIDMEKLAAFLPLHLMAVILTSDKDESLLRYLLCGIRVLHSLCDLASRNSKLEQVLFDDVKLMEKLIDLVFYILVILCSYSQENNNSSTYSIVYLALSACSLHLLTEFVSSQWQDLVQILVLHPKVDLFMDAVFEVAYVSIRFLQLVLSRQERDFDSDSCPTSEKILNFLFQQCEAIFQFLQALCQQKAFREHLLSNKELCGNGCILFIVLSVLKLSMTSPLADSFAATAAFSRIKSKAMFILLHLSEAESFSFLDEVASSSKSFELAKSVISEVLGLLRLTLGKDTKYGSSCCERTYPTGLLRLNALRLADIFSDDSNFRSYITACFTEVLAAIFSLPHGEFLSIWCSSQLPPREEDAVLEYDIFSAAGWVLDTISPPKLGNPVNLVMNLVPISMPQSAYSHQRTALFVKVIANLHCFVPSICEEQERNLFLNEFIRCCQLDSFATLSGLAFNADTAKAVTVFKNLSSLLSHAESLTPNFLNEEDVQLLRVFLSQLQQSIDHNNFANNQAQQLQEPKAERSISVDFSGLNIDDAQQEAHSHGGCSKFFPWEDLSDPKSSHKSEGISQNFVTLEKRDEPKIRSKNLFLNRNEQKTDKSRNREIESSGSDTGSTKGKNVVVTKGKPLGSLKKSNLLINSDGKVSVVACEEKQPRKRKRNIMNDYQISLIETALLTEPEMQRNAASIQSWADKLSLHGSEVTSAQLKNWLNNRKARLARASKEARAQMEERVLCERETRPAEMKPRSPGNSNRLSSSMNIAEQRPETAPTTLAEFVSIAAAEFVPYGPEMQLLPLNPHGEASKSNM